MFHVLSRGCKPTGWHRFEQGNDSDKAAAPAPFCSGVFAALPRDGEAFRGFPHPFAADSLQKQQNGSDPRRRISLPGRRYLFEWPLVELGT